MGISWRDIPESDPLFTFDGRWFDWFVAAFWIIALGFGLAFLLTGGF